VTGSPQSEAVPSRGRLLKILGIAFGLAVIIGNTIGVGILRTPGEVATQLPSTPLFFGVWIAGGLYALLGALTLAELGAMIPESGGQYVFARRSLGDYAGFVIGWSDWLSSCAALALVTMSMGDYSDVLWPALAGKSVAVAIAVCIILTVIQASGIRAGDLTQQITSLLKAVVLVGLAGVCLFWPASPMAPDPAAHAAPASLFALFAPLILALQGVIYTYDGWNGMLYFSGEVKDPGRDVPRAMAGGVIAVIVIYLLLNVAFLHVVPISRMAGEELVAATAARQLFGPAGDTVVRAILLVSLMSAANAILLIASRLPYALSRDGLLWGGFATVSKGGTPLPSLAISTVAGILLLATGTFNDILALTAFFFVVNYTASFLSVIILRVREPDLPRPYRGFGYPWIPGFLIVCSLAFLVGNFTSDAKNGVISLALLVASYPVYRLLRVGRRSPGAGA
jgi:APA family basic amino acid/polyamine antiporter